MTSLTPAPLDLPAIKARARKLDRWSFSIRRQAEAEPFLGDAAIRLTPLATFDVELLDELGHAVLRCEGSRLVTYSAAGLETLSAALCDHAALLAEVESLRASVGS